MPTVSPLIGFLGLEITPNGILMTSDYQGRSNGEAFVQFRNKGHAERALEKNKQSIGHRWGEYRARSREKAARKRNQSVGRDMLCGRWMGGRVGRRRSWGDRSGRLPSGPPSERSSDRGGRGIENESVLPRGQLLRQREHHSIRKKLLILPSILRTKFHYYCIPSTLRRAAQFSLPLSHL